MRDEVHNLEKSVSERRREVEEAEEGQRVAREARQAEEGERRRAECALLDASLEERRGEVAQVEASLQVPAPKTRLPFRLIELVLSLACDALPPAPPIRINPHPHPPPSESQSIKHNLMHAGRAF